MINGELGQEPFEIRNQSFYLLPSINFEWDATSDQTFRLGYETSINLPTLNQLAPLPDNSDPNMFIGGNPNLKPEYVHRVEFGYNLIDQFNFKNLFFNMNIDRIENRIVNQVTIDENLLTSIIPENTDRYLRIGGFGSYNAPIRPLKLKFNVRGQFQWSNYESSINGRQSDVSESNMNIKFSLENRMKDYVDIATGVRVDYNTRSYAINRDFDQAFFNTSWFVDGIFFLGEEWTFTAKYDYSSYSAEFFAESQQFHLLSASVTKTFADNKYSVFIRANDLLNQNLGIDRSGDLNSLYEYSYNTLQRYVLIGVQYRLGKQKKGDAISIQ